MRQILEEDASKLLPSIAKVITILGDGTKKTEIELEMKVGDDVTIANVKGYWVLNILRMDIKFRS